MFFDFIGVIPGDTMIKRSIAFCERSKSDNRWAFSCIIQYLQQLKERVDAKEISAGTMKNRYHNPLDLWSKCRPPEGEINSVKKIMDMGRKLHSSLYFVHIGSNASLDAILLEKQIGGCSAYVETCPHYLTHSVDYDNLKGKVVPPLRSKNDIASLWVAIRNGVIDTIGTDHVANSLNLKYGEGKDIWSALAGFPGKDDM